MKILLRFPALVICIVLLSPFHGCKMKGECNSSTSSTEVPKEELFYGLTANEILAMSKVEMKAFRTRKNINLIDWETLLIDLRNGKLRDEIKASEEETEKIYDRVDRKLGVKQSHE